MKADIEKALREFFPENRYDQLNSGLLDRAVKQSEVETVASLLRRLRPCEIEIEKPPFHYFCWKIHVYCPSKEEVRIQKWSAKKKATVYNSGPRYFLSIWISRIARYYQINWNRFEIKNGRFQADWIAEPGTADLRKFEAEVCTILDKEKFIRLRRDELDEAVPWMQADDSLIEGVPTVNNCLFSEV